MTDSYRVKLTAWVARDESGVIVLHRKRPIKHPSGWRQMVSIYENIVLPEDSFPQVKWLDEEPTEVELTVKIKNR